MAGGIGVTPIRAMLAVCVQRGYPVTLIYTVRRAGDAAFLSEFKEVLNSFTHFPSACFGHLPQYMATF